MKYFFAIVINGYNCRSIKHFKVIKHTPTIRNKQYILNLIKVELLLIRQLRKANKTNYEIIQERTPNREAFLRHSNIYYRFV